MDGHFAYMLVWQIQDTTSWHRTPSTAPARHQLRSGTVTVSFDDRMTPSVIEVGGTALVAAAVNRQHGFGPVTDDFLLCRPMGAVRVADVRADGLAAKLVTKPVVGRDHVLRRLRSLYVTDGTRLWTTVVVERLDGERYLLAGMPYVAADGDRFRRVGDFPLVAAAGELRLTHPEEGSPDSFDARSEVTQQQAAFALAADPRGYGDPDAGWRHVRTTTALEVGPASDAPEGLDVFAVRYGEPAAEPLDLVCEWVGEGLVVRTGSFTAVLGEADERGEPRLSLTPAGT